MLSVYGIKNCNTVKKGLDWLNKNKIDYEFFDVKKINLTDEKISEWIDNISEPYSPENLLKTPIPGFGDSMVTSMSSVC